MQTPWMKRPSARHAYSPVKLIDVPMAARTPTRRTILRLPIVTYSMSPLIRKLYEESAGHAADDAARRTEEDCHRLQCVYEG